MAQELTAAVREGLLKEGIGTGPLGIDYNTPDYKMFAALQRSCYRFSAAKSWQINKELNELLYDGTRIRPEAEFFRMAAETLDVFVGRYGAIERSTALVNSEMTAKVERFMQDVDIMPYWQYKTAQGENHCPICSGFADMIARYDAAVWRYAKPQLHYGCYCTIIQIPYSHATPTPEKDIPGPDVVPEVFRTDNTAKAQALPENHPYYTGPSEKKLNGWTNKNLPGIRNT